MKAIHDLEIGDKLYAFKTYHHPISSIIYKTIINTTYLTIYIFGLYNTSNENCEKAFIEYKEKMQRNKSIYSIRDIDNRLYNYDYEFSNFNYDTEVNYLSSFIGVPIVFKYTAGKGYYVVDQDVIKYSYRNYIITEKGHIIKVFQGNERQLIVQRLNPTDKLVIDLNTSISKPFHMYDSNNNLYMILFTRITKSANPSVN